MLYVTLSETAEELHEVAESRTDGPSMISICWNSMRLSRNACRKQPEYTVYHPSDVELGETTKRVARGGGAKLQPTRVALDSVSELKILSQTSARYRREILGLKQFFTGKQCTVLVLDDRTSVDGEQQLQSIAHGVIRMNRETRDYGDTRRQLQVVKMRGVRFLDGMHDFLIKSGGGLRYTLRLSMNGALIDAPTETITSDIRGMDELLGGGLDHGTKHADPGACRLWQNDPVLAVFAGSPRCGEVVSLVLFEESCEGFLQRATPA